MLAPYKEENGSHRRKKKTEKEKGGKEAGEAPMELFHVLSVDETVERFRTDLVTGLSPSERSRRLAQHGPNEFKGTDKVNPLTVLLRHIMNPITFVLIIAEIFSIVFTELVEIVVLAIVIVFNVAIGFYQEYRAEQTMDAMKKMSSSSAVVIIEGTPTTVNTSEVVPGDIVVIKHGDQVPADIRIFECTDLACDEALLTGETVPSGKSVEVRPDPTEPLGDRENMAFKNSTVAKGRGKGIVCRIGMGTQVGKIAGNLSEGKERKTDTQRVLDRMAYVLFFFAIIFGLIVIWANKWDFSGDVIVYAVSVGVAIVPSGLVGVMTLTMALGVNRMAEQKAVVRRLTALEAIGGITNICSDKTGTLTVGKMTVVSLWTPDDSLFDVSGTGLIPRGDITLNEEPVREMSSSLQKILTTCSLCNHASIRNTAAEGDADDAHDKMMKDAADQEDTEEEEEEEADGGRSEEEQDTEMEELSESEKEEEADGDDAEVVAEHEGKEESIQEWAENRRKARAAEKEAKKQAKKTKKEEAKQQKKEKKEAKKKAKTTESGGSASGSGNQEVEIDVRPDSAAEENWASTGDPTEVALQVLAHKKQMGRPDMIRKAKILGELPFDSSVKRMSVLLSFRENILSFQSNDIIVLSKGATDRILPICTQILVGNEVVPLTENHKERIEQILEGYASNGLRVLSFAFKKIEQVPSPLDRDVIETSLCFLGLAGLQDPPRQETLDAVQQCLTAGITVHMLTGDHPATAVAIAKEVAILTEAEEMEEGTIMTTTELSNMTDNELDKLKELPLVVARCSPDNKVQLIHAHHRRDHQIAMTGDGVNDAPAIKQADIGVAMGSGSDVAKGVADIVLSDDNFATILLAIREGRRIFLNIQKFVVHLMSCNVAEVLVLLLGLAFTSPNGYSIYLLSPVQILWLNLLTSSPPALGLGVEDAPPNIMSNPPKSRRGGLFTQEVVMDIFVYGTLMGSLTLACGAIMFYVVGEGRQGLRDECNISTDASFCDIEFRTRSVVFVTFAALFLFLAYECKRFRKSLLQTPVFKNKTLNQGVIIPIILVAPTPYIPWINNVVFQQKPIGWEWGFTAASVFVFFILCEIYKAIKRRIFRAEKEKRRREKAERASALEKIKIHTKQHLSSFDRFKESLHNAIHRDSHNHHQHQHGQDYGDASS
eukprot:TRINITY_DN933_c1_g1_i3.p1 TRINITY_DN933_c1_g1~~TRINITY_DN933_c1_g1_i3.p1  ORF type:complete len:1168 (-),score=364.62 TRINITY_DN933_c1_g1_i3:79-3582(-)